MTDEFAMSLTGSELVDKVAEVQQVGQRIIGIENSLVRLNEQRAKLRESFHAIGRVEADRKSAKTFTAVCPGLLVQYPNQFLRDSLGRDVRQVDETIAQTRAELRTAVDQLRKLEGDRDLTTLGYDLRAIGEESRE